MEELNYPVSKIVEFVNFIQLDRNVRYVGNVGGKEYEYKRIYFTTEELFNLFLTL